MSEEAPPDTALNARLEPAPLRPDDPDYVYASSLVRFGGMALDIIFLHIILIPLRLPATDWSFRQNSALPAALFYIAYFSLLFLWLRFKGLTPGGLPLGYRVVDENMRSLKTTACLRRLSPYMIIHFVGLLRLGLVLNGFEASGESYVLDEVREYFKAYGAPLNFLVIGLNFFVLFDMLSVLRSPRAQSLCDRLAKSYVVSKVS